MPELPDLEVYAEHLTRLFAGRRLDRLRVLHPFVLRSVDPPPVALEGGTLLGARRFEKRLVFELDGERYIVIHLMLAGRLRRLTPRAKVPRAALAAFDVAEDTVVLTEAGTTRRASLHLVRGASALSALARGGVDPLTVSDADFVAALRRKNRTLKRALTDPEMIAGVGNAYSDEILHRARLSPVTWTTRLGDEEFVQLASAMRAVLGEWTARLRAEAGDHFPTEVTAFREGMAVHGRYRKPCPRCGAPVQRLRFGGREANYCAPCQTRGVLLADGALSRLLRGDWPRTLEELEERRSAASGQADRNRADNPPSAVRGSRARS